MPAFSPLSHLYEVLQTVRDRAGADAAILRQNEAATRAALIDPVLRALGWDTANVRMVEPEKTAGSSNGKEWRADYALYNAEGQLAVVIEAKCLSHRMEPDKTAIQLLTYSFTLKPQTVLLTNGISWHKYDYSTQDTKPQAEFNLLRNNVLECATMLIGWLDALHFGYGLPPHETAPTLQVVGGSVPVASAELLADEAPAHIATNEFIPLTDVQTSLLAPGQKPKKLRLPDGTEKSIM